MKTAEKKSEAEPRTTREIRWLRAPVNVREQDDAYLLEVEMPGVAKDGVQVTYENGTLTIVGHRSSAEMPGEILYRESRSEDFRREFEIDPSIDAANITAKMEQGLLSLRLPKAEAVKPRTIEVTD